MSKVVGWRHWAVGGATYIGCIAILFLSGAIAQSEPDSPAIPATVECAPVSASNPGYTHTFSLSPSKLHTVFLGVRETQQPPRHETFAVVAGPSGVMMAVIEGVNATSGTTWVGELSGRAGADKKAVLKGSLMVPNRSDLKPRQCTLSFMLP